MFSHNILTLTMVAASMIERYRAVAPDGTHDINPLEPCAGFAQDDVAAGDDVPLRVAGTTLAILGEDLGSTHQAVQLDGEGRIIALRGGAAVGWNLGAGSEGDLVPIFLTSAPPDPTVTVVEVTKVGGIGSNLAIGFDGDLASAGARILGVTLAAGAEGDMVPVRTVGPVLATAGAQIASAGGAVEVDNAGRFITQDSGAEVGVNMETASGADASMKVVLK